MGKLAVMMNVTSVCKAGYVHPEDTLSRVLSFTFARGICLQEIGDIEFKHLDAHEDTFKVLHQSWAPLRFPVQVPCHEFQVLYLAVDLFQIHFFAHPSPRWLRKSVKRLALTWYLGRLPQV